jgi:carbonic anhydrase
LATGTLKLHAWVYKMETGEVFSYDPESGQYLPLTAPADPASPSPFRFGPATRAAVPAAAAG